MTRLQVGFGAYGEGNSKDLGQVFEFREQIEFGWQFDDGSMISAYFWHLSNAGISEDNPGVNAAGLHYSMAF
nr:acyloxyacyl hydrolase [Pyruvatibacter mobilis]